MKELIYKGSLEFNINEEYIIEANVKKYEKNVLEISILRFKKISEMKVNF